MYIQFYNKNLKKTERKRKERKNSSHTNKKLIGAIGRHMEPMGAKNENINLGWVSGGALSSIIFSSIGENFGA